MEKMNTHSDHAPIIVWFRNDLRLSDNPALAKACACTDRMVICLYIIQTDARLRPMGTAARWWLGESLHAFAKDIRKRGGRLIIRQGATQAVLDDVITKTGARSVVWNRRYDQAGRTLDQTIKTALQQRGIHAESFNSALLNEPWTYKTKAGTYHKVFTPYWKSVQAGYKVPPPCPAPHTLRQPANLLNAGPQMAPPRRPGLSPPDNDWTPGESGAQARLTAFMDRALAHYGKSRNRLDLDQATSKLSPHLAFGEIGPAQIWRSVQNHTERNNSGHDSAMVFLSEIAWREFSYVLLFHNPDLATKNFKAAFDHFPWQSDETALNAWKNGQTGYPAVDAGMRQLLGAGWMHNRARMITASFLTKHLLIHWSEGEAWFWDKLVDADPAANSASWQWTAGSGADAAPYFRIFNPILQGQKFDVTGAYIRRWCPELANLPDKYLFTPWKADTDTLRAQGIALGTTYPAPIVAHEVARTRALDAYAALRTKSSTT